MPDDHLLEVYKQLNIGYHAVDDFRAKLLGFLPLASGAVFITVLGSDKAGAIALYLREIGLLGMLITFGFLVYELKGIKKCTDFIFSGKAIEEKLLNEAGLTGKFSTLAKKSTWESRYATEPVASAIVYATVMAGWMYIAAYPKQTVIGAASPVSIWPSIVTWVIVMIVVIGFWQTYIRTYISNPTQKAKGNEAVTG